MEPSNDLLLTILSVAIIANSAVIAILLAVGRARRRTQAAARNGPAIDATLAASFVDHSARAAWTRSDDASGSAPSEQASDESAVLAGPGASTKSLVAVDPAEEPGEAVDLDAPTTWQRDDLTNLLDVSTFTRLVADEDARIRRYGRHATLVIFELDGLDRIVTRLGRDAGDRIVPAVADTIKRLARDADHVARLGAGRFAVLLPETDEVQAINYVERVRRACDLWLETGAIAMRLAIGWANSTGDPSLPETQRIATDRMYIELRRGERRMDVQVPEVGPATS